MTMHFRHTSAFAAGDRINPVRVLSEDEMHRAAPSIFAVEAHESRSDRFRPIPTIEILRGLIKEGFAPVHVKQSTTRDATKRDFTKHMIRLRPMNKALQVGDTFAEIVLKNANDGSSAYDLLAGLWRVRCLNGMVAQTSTIDTVKVRHTGDALSNVIEGTFRVLGQAENLLAAPQDWSGIPMNSQAREALAEAAHVLRFADAEGHVETPIRPQQLLLPRRHDDQARDLWTSFNVVQENVIKGGLSARAPGHVDARGRHQRGRMTTTREVKGIDQDVRLNKALWVLGERMASLLRSAA